MPPDPRLLLFTRRLYDLTLRTPTPTQLADLNVALEARNPNLDQVEAACEAAERSKEQLAFRWRVGLDALNLATRQGNVGATPVGAGLSAERIAAWLSQVYRGPGSNYQWLMEAAARRELDNGKARLIEPAALEGKR